MTSGRSTAGRPDAQAAQGLASDCPRDRAVTISAATPERTGSGSLSTHSRLVVVSGSPPTPHSPTTRPTLTSSNSQRPPYE